MATIVEKAAKGQKKAMESLYEKNKRKIFYIAKNLLMDENQAIEASVWVFDNLWSASFALKMTSEEEFTNEAVIMLTEYCRKKVSKQDSKALRTPANKNFQITDIDARKETESCEDFILRQFSDLQRFIFVLHTLCGFDNKQITTCIKLSPGILPIALEAEKSNIEALLKASGNQEGYTYETFADAFLKKENSISVPSGVDAQALSSMDRIAKPVEQKRKILTMITSLTTVVCLCVVVGLVFVFGSGKANGTQTDDALESGCYADIEIQNEGTITVKLDPEAAPVTTENFINLAESGFYDGLTFHRIMEGFMMQGGDPNGNGTGGSENTIVGEFSANGYDNPLSHTRGAIAMARSTDYNSASSQFYIVHEDSLFLDGQYAVFGYVTNGMEIVDSICESANPTDDNGTIPAEEQPVISSITIRTE